MIIDAHAHLGWDYVFDEDFTLQEQLDKHAEFGIEATILQPASCHDIEAVKEQHDRIAEVAATYPGPNPHLKDAEYEAEVRRCVESLGFVGIKLHTFAHAVHPAGRDGRKVFELARKLGVPVMVHTGAGIPFANPTNLINVAQDDPEVNIVMAHCGMMILAGETATAMRLASNLYADITWTAGFNMRHWCEEFGAERFLFGTDHADNAGTEIAKVRTCGIGLDEQAWIFGKSVEELYKLGL